jgi:hypothetical protein
MSFGYSSSTGAVVKFVQVERAQLSSELVELYADSKVTSIPMTELVFHDQR